MKRRSEIPEEIRQYLGLLIAEDLDRNEDHLNWLAENPDEPDRELQRVESEQAIKLARQAQRLFPAPPDPDDPAEVANAGAPAPQ